MVSSGTILREKTAKGSDGEVKAPLPQIPQV